MRDAYKILDGEPEGRPPVRSSHRWEDKMECSEVLLSYMEQ
jgi:hypothetical protein